MLKDLFQLYDIGKELGLTRKEINHVLFFEKRSPLILSILLIIILTVFAFLFWNVALSVFIRSTDTVYPRGTLYSSISLKDFKDKK